MARSRVRVGRVVFSTDKVVNSCVRVLVIAHHYNPISKARIRRIVKPDDYECS